MKIKPTYTIPLLTTLLAAGACSNDGSGEQLPAVPIVLSGQIEGATAGETRAGTALYNAFDGDEQIDVCIYKGSAVAAANVIGQENIVYSISAAGVMTPPTDMQPYFPNTADGQVTIRAAYPSGTRSRTVNVNQTSDADYKAGELLWATTTVNRRTSGTTAVPLIFQHRMAKIIVNLTSRNGSPILPTTVTLKSFLPTATVDMSTGAVTASGTATDITMSAGGAAMVPPQTHAANADIFEIATAQGDKATYAPTAAITFQAGYVYTYNIQVDMRKIIVTTTITSWGEPESGNIFEGDVEGEVWY